MLDTPGPVEVFYAFAPEDLPWVQELEKHLSLLQRQHLIATWHSRLIQAGEDWQHVIDTHLQNASIILLLVSPDFLASDYCYGVEMKRALEQEQTRGVRVIPVLLRPVLWKDAPFAHLHPLPSDETFLSEWPNPDRAFTEVTASIRRMLEDLSLLTIHFSQAEHPILWNVPFAHNPFFLGRDELLVRIHTRFQTEPTRRQAISGLGGIGKTRLAIEYAYCYRQEYQAIFWVRAENAETLRSSYMELAILLDLPEKHTENQEMIVQAVKRWLQRHRGWLLILDNADEPDQCLLFLPQSANGHTLLTTRATALRHLGIAQPLAMTTFSSTAGALFLLYRAGLLPPDSSLDDVPPQDRTLALQITRELGGLPLALDQAGAYLEATGADLATYQQVYQHHRTELLREHLGQDHSHPEPVATTWLLSFQRVQARNPAAAELLCLCSFLAPDAISEILFTQADAPLGPLLAPLSTDRYLLEKALEALRAYSLITRDATQKTFSVHRLVQHIVRDSFPLETQEDWKQRVVALLTFTFPSAADVSTWSLCEQLLPHALLCAHWIVQSHLVSPEAGCLLDATGYYLNHRGRYAEALPLLQRALSIREHVRGSVHPETAQTLTNLAYLLHHQGRYQDTEPYLQRALAIQEQTLGSNHPDTATSINALALLYRDQGKYLEAETHYQRALAIREQILGPDHPHTAHSLSNLAWLYRDQGRYAEALPLYERSLAIRQRILGPQHPDTATSLNGLALLYQKQGYYDQAQPLYEQVLDIRERVLGPTHPHTAQSINTLALLYQAQGKLAQAEPLLRQALTIREQTLGHDHPDTATSLHSLAQLAQAQHNYHEAESFFKQALTIRERIFGLEHPTTATSLYNLALLSQDQGRFVEAESLFKQALSLRERILGANHPDTQKTRAALAALTLDCQLEEKRVPEDREHTEGAG